MTNTRLVGALVLFLVLAVVARAASIPVEVSCHQKESDAIGMQLCSALRDAIAASPRYEEVEATKKWHWVVHIISTADDGNLSSAQSIVFTTTFGNGLEMFWDSMVLVTGQDKITYQAHSILAGLDQDISAMQAPASQ